MRKKLFLIPLFISLFLLGACSNNSTSQNSESSSSSSSVKTSKLVKSSSQKKSSSNKFSSSSQSSSSSSEVASDSSNAIPSSSVSASSSVSVSSQSQDVTTDNNSVLTSFLNASGVQLGNGDIAFITGKNNGMYEIEIRTQSPGSTAVTNLKGIYHYNPTTGSIQKMDPTTGVFN
ncbi:hypothetical protein [Ligilactobacillus salivarius]|jgi:cytoskeletal protein RodZ|uniref:Lipoprotein n=6 Tax=Bacilli TaxID=91061 RepID=F7QST1_9LACO|nr:hypothetical protein [Ligilactobacillus salivarius]AOO73167.1 hypothetical protein BHF65_02515 [Ligilactobacillus salivarius]EGM51846.1 hypothetical protein LSGJ_00265 [Ligilactobacillus salivarius GJ-24]EIA33414.1 hypothetical protein SMXD51_00244 [Ligilactobacillus salivarius SMXD51]MBM6956781.1 hypothetical protein [Ligilactobacillus salivarius]MDD1403187.1 hypothetical protein [Ligilactobacillus salivarius]